jgi:DNA adenine methylase
VSDESKKMSIRGSGRRPNTKGRGSSILAYLGDKTKAIPLLDTLLPENTKRLCSPFFGGGSFEIHCAMQRGIHVDASDAAHLVMNFWDRVKHDASNVQHYCRILGRDQSLTRCEQLQSALCSIDFAKARLSPGQRSIAAAVYYAVNRHVWHGGVCVKRCVDRRLTNAAIDRIGALDLAKIDFKVRDFRDTLAQTKDQTTLFLDPPYYIEDGREYYGKSGKLNRAFPHETLHKLLQARSNWILCYNNCKAIRRMYKGYRMMVPGYGSGNWQHAPNRELVIISHDIYDALQRKASAK